MLPAVSMATTGVRLVCPQFRQFEARRPELAPVLVIHEALHTLGLGENPPPSQAISRRIVERCQ